MTEAELYKELGILTKDKDRWKESIHDLDHEHLLAGILKCPICGASLAGTVRRKKYPSGKVNSTFYYRLPIVALTVKPAKPGWLR